MYVSYAFMGEIFRLVLVVYYRYACRNYICNFAPKWSPNRKYNVQNLAENARVELIS